MGHRDIDHRANECFCHSHYLTKHSTKLSPMPFSASLGSLDLPHNKSIRCNYFNTWSQDLRREMTSNIFIIVESLSRSYLWDLTVVLTWAAMLISASSASHHRILPCSSRKRQKNPSNADMPVVYMNVSCLLLITLDHLTFHALYVSRIALELSFRALYI